MWLPMGSDKAQRGNEKGNTRDTGSRVRDRKGARIMDEKVFYELLEDARNTFGNDHDKGVINWIEQKYQYLVEKGQG